MQNKYVIYVTALALAMDAFAVATSVSASLDRLGPRQVFRLSWHFGVFQSMMTLIGWLMGSALVSHIGIFDHWIAFGLLLFLGVKMIKESRDREGGKRYGDPTKGWSLVGLSLATSMDALAVGAGFGILRVEIWYPALVIGITALVLTSFGFYIGRVIKRTIGAYASLLGGIVLILIGLKILLEGLGFL